MRTKINFLLEKSMKETFLSLCFIAFFMGITPLVYAQESKDEQRIHAEFRVQKAVNKFTCSAISYNYSKIIQDYINGKTKKQLLTFSDNFTPEGKPNYIASVNEVISLKFPNDELERQKFIERFLEKKVNNCHIKENKKLADKLLKEYEGNQKITKLILEYKNGN